MTATADPIPSSAAAKRLQCLEVWGGNTPVDTAVSIPGLDAWVYSRPCSGDTSGGDLHYLSSCASGHVVRLLLADVAGHGAAVAETAATLRKLIRRFVQFPNQTRLVNAINRHFIPLTPAGRFATAVILTFKPDTGKMSFTNAGHPEPLHYSRKSKTWSFVRSAPAGETTDAVNIPLGIDKARYELSPITPAPNDLILCYTDGLVEARKPDGEFLGAQGLLDLLTKSDPARPENLIPSLVQQVLALNPANATHDDLTLLLLRPNGAGRPGWFLRDLIAPFRYIASWLHLHNPGMP
jgi:sigma-B regulation protein RsbU (phosphoserine phosphatase)